ncbi:uncharacterized protein [Amphiura filiformis]|uniref:uncharacterized protein n=1 Tax=Amphiura filiformis TaxID=82378 RepID=UPI003B21CDFF
MATDGGEEAGGTTVEMNGEYAGTAPCYEPLITRQPISHTEAGPSSVVLDISSSSSSSALLHHTAPHTASVFPPAYTDQYPPPPYPGHESSLLQQPYTDLNAPYTIHTNDPPKYFNPPEALQVPNHQAPPNVTVVRTRDAEADVGPKPYTYMVCSILSTVFCCLIFGILAIVFSAKVSSHWSKRRYTQARLASSHARSCNVAAVTIGSVFIVFNIIRIFALFICSCY